MVVRIHTNKCSGGSESAFPAAAPFAPVPTVQDGADMQLDIALGRADRARAQSASALTFENILAESADQAADDGSGIVEAVNIRLDQHIRDALEVYTDSGEREAMMDLLEGQAEPVRSRARDRQIEVRSGHLRSQVAGVTDDWAAQARMNPAEAPMIAMRAAAAVHAVADNDDAPVISAERMVQATERKVLSAALVSLLERDPDWVPALLAEPDGPYRQAFPEDHLEEARAEAEVRVRARSAETLARLERAIDEGSAGPLELKQAAREDWLDKGAQARMQGRLETRTAEARAGRERILRVAELVAGGGSLDSLNIEDREAADVYYESVVAPGLEALDPAERIGEAAGFAHRFGVLPKEARRQIRGGLVATEPAVRARAADAVVRLGETAPELTRDFDPGLRTEAYLIAGLVDSGVDAARAVEMADGALARNSTADRAERERRIGEENHAAENERFLVAREDDIAEWFAGEGGLTGIIPELRDALGEKTRTVFLRTGDLAVSQNIALADLRRERLLEAREAPGETMEFRPGRDDHPGETMEFDLTNDKDPGVLMADTAASDDSGEGGEPAGEGEGPEDGDGDVNQPDEGEISGAQPSADDEDGASPADDGIDGDGKDSRQKMTPDMTESDGDVSTELGPRAPDANFTEKVDNAEERFEEFYKQTEIREGKIFTDYPTDKGGPTKLGITQDSLNDYHAWKEGKAKSIPTDAKNLTPEDARTIYKEFYHDRYRVGEIVDPKMAEHIFDINVNPGPDRAARWAQQEINRVTGADVKMDGIMGSKTIHALNTLNPEQRRQVMNGIADKRETFYNRRAEGEPDQKDYLPGWINRAQSFQQ